MSIPEEIGPDPMSLLFVGGVRSARPIPVEDGLAAGEAKPGWRRWLFSSTLGPLSYTRRLKYDGTSFSPRRRPSCWCKRLPKRYSSFASKAAATDVLPDESRRAVQASLLAIPILPRPPALLSPAMACHTRIRSRRFGRSRRTLRQD